MSRIFGPKISAMTWAALGPCTAKGQTSGSLISTLSFAPSANPLTQSRTSESAIDNQNLFSEILRSTGSFIKPAFSVIRGTYKHFPGVARDKSLGVIH